MSTPRHSGFCVAGVVAAALLFAGCEGDDGGRTAPGPGTKPPGPAPVRPAGDDRSPRWDVSVAPAPPPAARIRPPAVAGTFYPGGAEELRRDVEARLARAGRAPQLAGELRAVIVPHAGYRYSGNTAAAACAAVRGRGFDRVVLLGPSHRHPLRGVSVSGHEFYRTPLGPVAVDTRFAAELREKAGASFVEAAHAREHALEVQLPFLQVAVGPGVRVVPVLVGPDAEAGRKLAAALTAMLDERTLVAVCTDLAHYPSQEVAEKVDAATVESWKTLDPEKVTAVERRLMSAGHANLDCAMCGGDSVRVLMRMAPALGVDSVAVLRTETSAAGGGDRESVVGYAAAAFLRAGRAPGSREESGERPDVSAAGRKKLLEIARAAAAAAAAGGSAPRLDLASLPEELRRPGGAFVTLKNAGRLRGCIGRFPGDEPVARVVNEMGAEAARDSRFEADPVTAGEMAGIRVEISVLSPLRRLEDWRQVRVGVHGVMLRRGMRRGVYLPQVAAEQGWNREQFLRHLAGEKAGMSPDAYRDPDTEIWVFTALVFGEKE